MRLSVGLSVASILAAILPDAGRADDDIPSGSEQCDQPISVLASRIDSAPDIDERTFVARLVMRHQRFGLVSLCWCRITRNWIS